MERDKFKSDSDSDNNSSGGAETLAHVARLNEANRTGTSFLTVHRAKRDVFPFPEPYEPAQEIVPIIEGQPLAPAVAAPADEAAETPTEEPKKISILDTPTRFPANFHPHPMFQRFIMAWPSEKAPWQEMAHWYGMWFEATGLFDSDVGLIDFLGTLVMGGWLTRRISNYNLLLAWFEARNEFRGKDKKWYSNEIIEALAQYAWYARVEGMKRDLEDAKIKSPEQARKPKKVASQEKPQNTPGPVRGDLKDIHNRTALGVSNTNSDIAKMLQEDIADRMAGRGRYGPGGDLTFLAGTPAHNIAYQFAGYSLNPGGLDPGGHNPGRPIPERRGPGWGSHSYTTLKQLYKGYNSSADEDEETDEAEDEDESPVQRFPRLPQPDNPYYTGPYYVPTPAARKNSRNVGRSKMPGSGATSYDVKKRTLKLIHGRLMERGIYVDKSYVLAMYESCGGKPADTIMAIKEDAFNHRAPAADVVIDAEFMAESTWESVNTADEGRDMDRGVDHGMVEDLDQFWHPWQGR
ncbi:uncharacterized protein L3040_002594 [Drepanopeziza brunnea f. sp. 'multigermtubi']|uniref:uncharacterized protein n=1 Tax=Drepanopeziza brunnea f. sp. 'multigermtubi' TaxID=698441 RepID=UPI0023980CF5|nr:hypothetical protein L3040_002594 [Drepanopeziza brunnea f. sp. 'multigermtubi']